MDTQVIDDYFTPDFDLGTFRYLAARYVKLLIRARWQCEPGFLSTAELTAWQLVKIADDREPAWRLLAAAARDLSELNRDYLPRCNSGGVRETDASTPVGRLIPALSFLADCSMGGGPAHNMMLLKASQQLRNGQTVQWDVLVDWSALPAIRADLDRLPHPQPQAASTSAPPSLERNPPSADTSVASIPITPAPPLPPEALSKTDAAQFLGVSVAALEQLIRTRKLQYVQLGAQRGRVIPVAALRQLMADHLQLTGEEGTSAAEGAALATVRKSMPFTAIDSLSVPASCQNTRGHADRTSAGTVSNWPTQPCYAARMPTVRSTAGPPTSTVSTGNGEGGAG